MKTNVIEISPSILYQANPKEFKEDVRPFYTKFNKKHNKKK